MSLHFAIRWMFRIDQMDNSKHLPHFYISSTNGMLHWSTCIHLYFLSKPLYKEQIQLRSFKKTSGPLTRMKNVNLGTTGNTVVLNPASILP